MPHDLFLSYASHDKPVADAVCAALEAEGMRCWIAPRDVLPGRSFAGEITRGIHQSKAMVLIFSGQSNGSDQVLREVQLAVKARLHIVQFRIEDVALTDDLQYFLGTPHWLDALTPPLANHIERLRTALKALLNSSPVPLRSPTSNVPAAVTISPSKRPSRRSIWLWSAVVLAACALIFFLLRHGDVSEPIATTETPKVQVPDDGWLQSSDYQHTFEAQLNRGFYPYRVDGRVNAGHDEFHVTWRRAPKNCAFWAHHGLTRKAFEENNAKHLAEGLTLTCLSQFVNTMGFESYQAVWSRNCNP
jgi:hypothetical protein